MKVTSYFSVIFILITLISIPVDAMKRLRDTGTAKLQCSHLTESIEVSETILKHSDALNDLFIKSPFASSYSVDVADQETLSAMIDCLKIIDADREVKNKLLDYLYDFVTRYTEESERENFYNAMESLKIQQLSNSFNFFPGYYTQRNANDVANGRLNMLMQEAKDVFLAIKDKENSAIVIDVDDTALSNAKSLNKITVNGVETPVTYYSALNQVRDLYKQMVDLGFKIFFLTARVDKLVSDLTVHDQYQATIQNLKEEGYNIFEQVICVPYEVRQQMWKDSNGDNDLFVDLHAQWKENERNKIAAKYTIVGTLDDLKENLQGKNLGHAVLIPKISTIVL